MTVFINNTEIFIFNGARLQDALLAYSKTDYHLLLEGKIRIEDERGNGMDLDGSLWDGIRLFIKQN